MNRPTLGHGAQSDDLLREAFAIRAGSARPDGLRERILAGVAATGQRQAWVVRLGDPATVAADRRLLLVAAAAALAIAMLALALGGGALRTAPPRLGVTPAVGERIAYSVWGDIYIADADGGNARLVWDEPSAMRCQHLLWAGPSTLLVANEEGVHAVDVESGRHRLVAPGIPLGATPDGGRAVVLDPSSGDPSLGVVDLATGDVVWKGSSPQGPAAPLSWSQDGTWLLGENGGTLVRVDAATGRQTAIVGGLSTGLNPHTPVLAPDERTVVYADYRPGCLNGCGTLFAVPVTGGVPTRLTPVDGSELAPTISPDGRWVVYFVESGTPDAPVFRLAVVGIDGSGGRPVGVVGQAGGGFLDGIGWDPDSAGFVTLRQTGVQGQPASSGLWHVSLVDGSERPLGNLAVDTFAREPAP